MFDFILLILTLLGGMMLIIISGDLCLYNNEKVKKNQKIKRSVGIPKELNKIESKGSSDQILIMEKINRRRQL